MHMSEAKIDHMKEKKTLTTTFAHQPGTRTANIIFTTTLKLSSLKIYLNNRGMYNTLMSASWLYGFQPRLLVLRAGWYDFATRVAKPRVKAKSYHPNRKTSRSG